VKIKLMRKAGHGGRAQRRCCYEEAEGGLFWNRSQTISPLKTETPSQSVTQAASHTNDNPNAQPNTQPIAIANTQSKNQSVTSQNTQLNKQSVTIANTLSSEHSITIEAMAYFQIEHQALV